MRSKSSKHFFAFACHFADSTIVGKKGVEKIEVINLDEKEKSEFINSVNAVKKLWEAASKIDPDLAK